MVVVINGRRPIRAADDKPVPHTRPPHRKVSLAIPVVIAWHGNVTVTRHIVSWSRCSKISWERGYFCHVVSWDGSAVASGFGRWITEWRDSGAGAGERLFCPKMLLHCSSSMGRDGNGSEGWLGGRANPQRRTALIFRSSWKTVQLQQIGKLEGADVSALGAYFLLEISNHALEFRGAKAGRRNSSQSRCRSKRSGESDRSTGSRARGVRAPIGARFSPGDSVIEAKSFDAFRALREPARERSEDEGQ